MIFELRTDPYQPRKVKSGKYYGFPRIFVGDRQGTWLGDAKTGSDGLLTIEAEPGDIIKVKWPDGGSDEYLVGVDGRTVLKPEEDEEDEEYLDLEAVLINLARMITRAPKHCHYCEHWSTTQTTGKVAKKYRSWCDHYDQHAQYVQDRCIEEGAKS